MGGLLGGGGGGGTAPVLDKSAFDLSKATKKYGGMTDAQIKQAKQRQDFTNAANQALIQQLQGQSQGQGPSLAQAQLKAMQDRGLAQTMAAAAAQRGGNPALAQRQLLMQQAQAGRANAQQGAILGLQERQGAQQLLAGQLTAGQGQADQLATGSIQQGFGQQQQAKQLMSQYEQQRFAADTARQNAIKSQQNGILGGILGAAGTIGGAALGSMVAPGVGTAAGASIGGSMGSSFADRAPGTTEGGFHLSHGGEVPGEAEVPGDSIKNDKVPAILSPGEIVIPRSIVQAGPDAAKSFVEALLKREAPASSGYASVAAKKMNTGGIVRAPAQKAEREYSQAEKPVQNQWKGADQALDNLKNAFSAKRKKD